MNGFGAVLDVVSFFVPKIRVYGETDAWLAIFGQNDS